MLVWPVLYALAVTVVTTWDILPPNSKAYDVLPPKIAQQLAANVSIDRAIVEWLSEKWKWDPTYDSNVALTWVNGINYTTSEMEEHADLLTDLFGCKVRPYYNPSLGWWLKDLTRVSYMYITSPLEDPVVTGLAKHLKQVLSEVGPTGHVVHLAHSGGALLTYLVAKHHLDAAERQRIHVVNFGGARSITRKYFAKAVNYYARNDPILYVNRRAYALMLKVMNQTDQEVIYHKHNTSFVFLRGRAQSALADHSFMGPTYMEAIQREAAAFRNLYSRQGFWYRRLPLFQFSYLRKPADMTWMRYIRKRSASITGLHGFFRDRGTITDLAIANMTLTRVQAQTAAFKTRQSVRSIRKAVAAATGMHGFFSGKNVTTTDIIPVVVADRRWWRRLSTSSGNLASSPSNVTITATTTTTTTAVAALPSPPSPAAVLIENTTTKDLIVASDVGVTVDSNYSTALVVSSEVTSSLDVYQRIRLVRKAVARQTGMRGFFSRKNVTDAVALVDSDDSPTPPPVVVSEDHRWWLRLRRQQPSLPPPPTTSTNLSVTNGDTLKDDLMGNDTTTNTTTTTTSALEPPSTSVTPVAVEEPTTALVVVVPENQTQGVDVYQRLRLVRKSVARRTGMRGFFSGKGKNSSTTDLIPPEEGVLKTHDQEAAQDSSATITTTTTSPSNSFNHSSSSEPPPIPIEEEEKKDEKSVSNDEREIDNGDDEVPIVNVISGEGG